jgi:hypothetical protein
LPGVGDRLAIRIEGARPVVLAVAAAAGCEFPLRLGGQLTPAPARIGERILIGDIEDGMIVLANNRADTSILPTKPKNLARAGIAASAFGASNDAFAASACGGRRALLAR